MRAIIRFCLLVLLAMPAPIAAAPIGSSDFPWQEWSDQVFERAAREKKMVLLSLQSWWCPWCKVMNEVTYDDPATRAYLLAHFIPVRVDQDSRPDISQRYENWGWPATVIFAADGTEIVKLRGFYSPQFFTPVLVEAVKDPTPVNYGAAGGPERGRHLSVGLSDAQRQEILGFIDKAWDEANGGWTKSKLVEAPILLWALERAYVGDTAIEARVRRHLTNMAKLIDPATGAIGQITKKPDWSEPAREFPMFAQMAALKAWSLAYLQFGEPAYLQSAKRVADFLTGTMRGPGGGFYASMGTEDKNRAGIDKNQYARENGQAIQGLLAYYDATGDRSVLAIAQAAAEWALAHRSRPDGGFNHGPGNAGGPYLADTLEMAWALLALHRSTGGRQWLTRAGQAGEYIARNLIDEKTGGFFTAAAPESKVLRQRVKQKDDNVQAVRLFNLLHFYTGREDFREIAKAGMGYLTSPAILDAFGYLPDLLQAEQELQNEPLHATIVGAKGDASAAALYRAALAYPFTHKRVEWWDKSEGRLANPDVEYPDYPGPAAFACTRNFCSLPVTEPKDIAGQLRRLNRALPAGK